MSKVAFLIYSLHGGGAERMISRLANAFIKKGIETDIIVFVDGNEAYEIEPAVKIICCADFRPNKVERTVCAVNGIRKIVKKEKIDVLFAFTVSMFPYAVLAATGLHCKVIGSERANPMVMSHFRKAITKLSSKLCDGIIFQTKGAMSCYPIAIQKKSIIVGNIAPQISLSDVTKYEDSICSVGRLNNDKDFVTLILAMAKVHKENHNAKLAIFGDGEQKQELIELANSLGISGSIFFEGFAKDVNERLQKYSVFAFSSKAEGLPNALLEAMSAGLPCISTDCDFGPRELIEDGKNGFLVPVGDSEMMAQRIIELLSNQTLRNRLGEKARKVQETYSEDVIAETYICYIEKISKK